MAVSEQIIQVINDLCAKFGMAVDWTSENVWPYLQELFGKYIKFEIATSGALCALFVVLMIIAYSIAKKAHAKAKQVKWDFDYERAPWVATIAWIVFGAFSLVGVIVIMVQVFDIITCLTFPEKQIFDYIMKLTTPHV